MQCKLASVLQAASGLVDTLLFCPQQFLQCLVKVRLVSGAVVSVSVVSVAVATCSSGGGL
jgi:hypothetical protein